MPNEKNPNHGGMRPNPSQGNPGEGSIDRDRQSGGQDDLRDQDKSRVGQQGGMDRDQKDIGRDKSSQGRDVSDEDRATQRNPAQTGDTSGKQPR